MQTKVDIKLDGTLAVESTRYGSEVLVVSLSGELDHAVVQKARSALEPALADSDGLVVIDLGDLESIDSSGIAMLYRLARVRADGSSLRLLRSRHAAVNRILDLTEVGRVMNVVAA